jgi:hypothetical protein
VIGSCCLCGALAVLVGVGSWSAVTGALVGTRLADSLCGWPDRIGAAFVGTVCAIVVEGLAFRVSRRFLVDDKYRSRLPFDGEASGKGKTLRVAAADQTRRWRSSREEEVLWN